MEITENKGKEPDEARNARMESVSERKYKKRVLAIAGSGILHYTITNERLARRGYYNISEAYKSLHLI